MKTRMNDEQIRKVGKWIADTPWMVTNFQFTLVDEDKYTGENGQTYWRSRTYEVNIDFRDNSFTTKAALLKHVKEHNRQAENDRKYWRAHGR